MLSFAESISEPVTIHISYSAAKYDVCKLDLRARLNSILKGQTMNGEKYTNRLIEETSPYLLQHAHNPVDWNPWDKEALERAKREDKPILLSVGYSACHWCHVMEHESFENEEIARIMNENFINIKVDREERPDIDEIYMNAVQAMTSHGGWPMTVFLTPHGEPFYGGTYFPPDDRQGIPGFPRLLKSVAQFYRDRKDDALKQGSRMKDHLHQLARLKSSAESTDESLLTNTFRATLANFDNVNGGFGSQPKFPGTMNLALFLREYKRTGAKNALEMVNLSLSKMANGGIYDQLGGGFHRYSVDSKWLVPHFEKMLYDNALLMSIYLEAYQATGDDFYSNIVEETASYLLREMFHGGDDAGGSGGFYSTQDADSEGEEGKFFVWTPDQVKEILGAEDSALFCRYYDITPSGNFENGLSILHVSTPLENLARFLKVDEDHLRQVVKEGKAKLFAERGKRVKPGRDDKIQTNWNGMMISSFAEAYKVLGTEEYRLAAENSASFILNNITGNGRLFHSYKDDRTSSNVFQDDYALFIGALLDLYEATFDSAWLTEAIRLNDIMIDHFWDEVDGGFFFTPNDHEELIVRSKNPYDNAVPAGNSIGVLDLLRISAITYREDLWKMAERALTTFHDFMKGGPSGFGQLLCGLDFFLQRPLEIAIVGDPEQKDTKEMLEVIHSRFLPNKVMALLNPDGDGRIVDIAPLLKDKTQVDSKATVYVCQNFTCSKPMNDPRELGEFLDSV